MNKRKIVYLLTAGLVTVLAVFIYDNEKSDSQTSEIIEPAVPDPIDKSAIFSQPLSAEDTLVASLAGTHHGVTLASRNNDFIVTASLKDLFDYYLSAAGEENIEEIDLRVREELQRQLQGKAFKQAISIWQSYINYKRQLVEFDQQYSTESQSANKKQQLQLLKHRQQALIALQDQVFGAGIAQILFKFDRLLDNFTLEKSTLLASDLSEEQLQQRLLNLSAQLPIDSVLSKQRNEQQKALMTISQTEGLTEQQKYQQRVQQVGAAAASRLQQLDEKRAAWKGRLTAFKNDAQLLQKAGLADKDYEDNLDKLYHQHFAPEEQLRARALTAQDE